MSVAIVTGASGGLGRLIAQALAHPSIKLLLVGRDANALAEVKATSRAAEVAVFVDDLEDPEAPSRIAAAAAAMGDVTILVNNAAVQGPTGLAWLLDTHEVRKSLDVNLVAPMMLCAEIARGMVERRQGWIVNISGGGATGPRPLVTPYAVAKTGLVRFSETLALEGKPYGLRVNAIAPGAFASNMTRSLLDRPAMQDAQELGSVRRLIAADDRSSAERAAKLISYLVLGAGRDVTGKLISAIWDEWETMHEDWPRLDQSGIYTLRRQTTGDQA